MADAADASAAAGGRPETLLAGLGDLRIDPVRPDSAYLVAMVGGLLAAVLLPLLHLGAIGGIGYALLAYGRWVLGPGGDVIPSFFLRGVAFVVPNLAGVALITTMIGAIVARRPRPMHPYALDRSVEPWLAAFVDRVAEAVGAPSPDLIELGPDVDAWALVRGRLEGRGGRRFVLMIGLPLIEGLDARQLAGLVAHELGHFSQRGGTSIGRLARRAIERSLRAAFSPSVIDSAMVSMMHSSSGVVTGVGALAMLVSMLGRAVLAVAGLLGVPAALLLMRRGEFDADRYAARLIGSDATIGMLRRIRDLATAEALVMERLESTRGRRPLPANLAAEIVAEADRLPPQEDRRFRVATPGIPLTMLSTHPSNAAREVSIRRERRGGLYRAESASGGDPRDLRPVGDQGRGGRTGSGRRHPRADPANHGDAAGGVLVGVLTLRGRRSEGAVSGDPSRGGGCGRTTERSPGRDLRAWRRQLEAEHVSPDRNPSGSWTRVSSKFHIANVKLQEWHFQMPKVRSLAIVVPCLPNLIMSTTPRRGAWTRSHPRLRAWIQSLEGSAAFTARTFGVIRDDLRGLLIDLGFEDLAFYS